MNTPETINIEKYAEALNELIGVDSAYMVGDKSVDTILELIVAAKKLENKVKELTEENEKLKAENEDLKIYYKDFKYRLKEAQSITSDLVKESDDLKAELWECVNIKAQTKADTVRKMQEKIRAKSEYGTINISSWQLDQIAEEMLEENNNE